MDICLRDIVKILKEKNNFYILTHKTPDGDTLGSAFALCLALQKIGKNAKVLCSDEIPKKYELLYQKVKMQNFDAQCIISVDLADTNLLGEKLSYLSNKIDLCIDHHSINSNFAKYQYIDSKSAATAEIIYQIIKIFNISIDQDIATCIYTGISTDTGCFRHTNTTSNSYRVAANMIDCGANAFKINKIMFDTKSKTQLYIEKIAIENMEFFFKDECALIAITNDVIAKYVAEESIFDGLSSLPRQVEGVLIGILLKEIEPNTFKISIRSDEIINAAEICANFSGGGHKCAAGCTITGELHDVKDKILSVVSKHLQIK